MACILGLLAASVSFTPVAAAVGTLTLLSPSTPSGTPGSTVIVQGSGFSASSGVVYFDTTGFAVPTISGGTFTAIITVPALAPGSYQITASTGSDNSTPILFTIVASSSFSLSAFSGLVGDSVTITGSGFSTTAATTFYWDSAFLTSATASGSPSTLSGTFIIPAAARGPHTITASLTGTQPQTFSVASNLVISSPSPASGGVGDAISLTGTGFAPSANVTISVDGAPVTVSPAVITNTTGGFTAAFIMPTVASGVRTIQATDGGGYDATPPTFAIGPKITLSTSSGLVGSNVIISGNGFSALQNLTVQIETAPGSGLYSTTPLTTIPASPAADSSGAFGSNTSPPNPISFAIPGIAGGTYKIKVTDQLTHSATANVTVLPTMSITPGNGTVGTQVTVTGSGFAPSLGVNIFWDAVAITTTPATVTSSATGTISATFASPPSAGGTHTVKAQDTQGSSASATFTAKPKIVLTPATGAYGDSITITFSGFTASSNVTTVQLLSGSTSAYSLTTTPPTVAIDANGSGSATFSVINVSNGSWTVQAADSSGGSAQATLAVTQKIILTTATGVAGDVVTVTGTGFAINKPITANYGTLALTLTFSQGSTGTDSTGSFAALFTVPATAAGAITIKVGDGPNVTGNTSTATFTTTAKATVSKATTKTDPGYVGMELTVSGTGFKSASDIVVTFESAPVTVATVTSDVGGSFTATFKVPAGVAGNHTIKATDNATTREFSFFMDSTPPAAPALLTPLDKFKPKQPVPFSWGAVTDPSGVTYTFQISQDSAFTTLILEKKDMAGVAYKMTDAEKLKSAGVKVPYYWRVRATDAAGNVSGWSTANTFTIGFIWPSWIIHVWYGLGIVVALILGLWFGRRMAYQSY